MGNYDSIYRNTWVGVGLKVGGGLIAGGVESTTGVLFNCLNPSWCRPFSIESVRFQFGVGGGVGTSVVIIFNCPSIFTIDKTDIRDWSINFSLGPNWKAVLTNLTKLGFFGKAIKAKNALKSAQTIEELKGVKVVASLDKSDLEGIRNGISYAYNANEVASRGNQLLITALDVPGAGIGAEIAICPFIAGKFNVLPW